MASVHLLQKKQAKIAKAKFQQIKEYFESRLYELIEDVGQYDNLEDCENYLNDLNQWFDTLRDDTKSLSKLLPYSKIELLTCPVDDFLDDHFTLDDFESEIKAIDFKAIDPIIEL